MKKVFCDKCGEQITDQNRMSKDALSRIIKGVTILAEVKITFVDKKDEVDICKYCQIDAIKKLDDRPDDFRLE